MMRVFLAYMTLWRLLRASALRDGPEALYMTLFPLLQLVAALFIIVGAILGIIGWTEIPRVRQILLAHMDMGSSCWPLWCFRCLLPSEGRVLSQISGTELLKCINCSHTLPGRHGSKHNLLKRNAPRAL